MTEELFDGPCVMMDADRAHGLRKESLEFPNLKGALGKSPFKFSV